MLLKRREKLFQPFGHSPTIILKPLNELPLEFIFFLYFIFASKIRFLATRDVVVISRRQYCIDLKGGGNVLLSL